MTPGALEQLVAAEVASIPDPERRRAVSEMLVAPHEQQRESMHVDGVFTCWVVARYEQTRQVFVYCRGPFCDPWGCLDEDGPDLGMDSQWFETLDGAFRSFVWHR